jgi:hypothetical protein
MKRHCIAVAASACALALTPSAALAGNNSGPLGGLIQQTQTATNQNITSQSATSEASSKQTNINAPISILSVGSNDGGVSQSNKGSASSKAGNVNGTEQDNHQSQDGSAGR